MTTPPLSEFRARQGDILLERIRTLPEGIEPASRDAFGQLVLARHEHSDHSHAIRDAHVRGFRLAASQDVDWIEVGGSGAALTHEHSSGERTEHEPLALAPGVYRVVRQREYVAAHYNRRVTD